MNLMNQIDSRWPRELLVLEPGFYKLAKSCEILQISLSRFSYTLRNSRSLFLGFQSLGVSDIVVNNV